MSAPGFFVGRFGVHILSISTLYPGHISGHVSISGAFGGLNARDPAARTNGYYRMGAFFEVEFKGDRFEPITLG